MTSPLLSGFDFSAMPVASESRCKAYRLAYWLSGANTWLALVILALTLFDQ